MIKRADAQVSIASTLSPPGPVEPDSSIGALLFAALFDGTSRKDAYTSWFASNILAHIIQGNQRCKDLLLEGSVSFGEHQGPLLALISSQLLNSDGVDVRVVVGFLSLLSIWLQESEKSVSAFLAESSNLQFVSTSGFGKMFTFR